MCSGIVTFVLCAESSLVSWTELATKIWLVDKKSPSILTTNFKIKRNIVVAVTDVHTREMARREKQKFHVEDMWDGRYNEQSFPIFRVNTSFLFSPNFLTISDFKIFFETVTNPNHSQSSTIATPINTSFNRTTKSSTQPIETKPTDAPFTSRLETNIAEPSTTSVTESKPNDPSTTSTTELKFTDDYSNILTKETSPTIPSSSTTEAVFGETSSVPLPESRLANTTQESEPIDIEAEATTLSKYTAFSSSTIDKETTNGVNPTEPIDAKVDIDSNRSDADSQITTLATTPTTSAPQEETTPNFCLSSYEPPEKPDFSAPGKRISESKCEEFIWELKNRKTQKEQTAICRKYRKKWLRGRGHGIGGRNTKPGEFPHMGALGWKAVAGSWVFKCGGSLISEKYVLTAAHCTKASPRDTTIAELDPKIVRIGDKNIIDRIAYNSPPRQDAMISRIIVHPQYKAPTQYYDIALLELDEVVEFSRYVQPACLWNKFSTSELGKEAIGTGWGVIESGSHNISPELQAVTVDVLETDLCDQLLKQSRNRNWQGFQDHQLCAGKLAGGVDSCQGDSGGPLQMKMRLPTDITNSEGSMHFVVGIISFGVGCAHPNLPGVYTRVSSFIDWIEENVWTGE